MDGFSINGKVDSDSKYNEHNRTKEEQTPFPKKKRKEMTGGDEESGRICDKCREQLNSNTDAMSQSAVSISTAYGSQMFSKSNENLRRKERGDADGGEPVSSKRSPVELEFINRRYRKFVFLPGYKLKQPADTFSKKEDEAMYHALKSNKDIEYYKETGLSFNVINAAWINSWHKYINDVPGSKHPGRIKNLPIA